MRFNLLVAAFVVSAIAAPVAEPEAAAAVPAGYGVTTTATVTVGPGGTTTKSSTSTKKTTSTSTKKSSTTSSKSTVTVGPIATTKTTSTTSKKTTSTTSKKTTSTTSKKTTSTTSSKTSTTSSKTSTTSSKTTSTPASVPTTLAQIAVYHHNIHRSNHSASNVAWSDSLALTAAKIAASCNYAHDTSVDGGGYGQNIAAGLKADNISAVITELFYNGEMPYYNGLYGQAQPSYANFAHWGHFSQIVWKDTTTIGCAVQYCPDGLANTGGSIPPYFTVCNYEPAGNYGGEYADNIGSPLGHPVAHWNTGLSGA